MKVTEIDDSRPLLPKLLKIVREIEAKSPSWLPGIEEVNTTLARELPTMWLDFGKCKNGGPCVDIWDRETALYQLSLESNCGMFKVEDAYL